MQTNNKKCVLYSAFNNPAGTIDYTKEAVSSATATRKYLPSDIDLVLHTPHSASDNLVFDKVQHQHNYEPRSKPFSYRQLGFLQLEHSGYEQIVFLDTDAFLVNTQALDIFEILCEFDIAAAHAPIRSAGLHNEDVPDCFPEFNCGVLAFNNTQPVRSFISEWRRLYLNDHLKHPHDQGAFRHALYFSNLRIATLPREYNYRAGAQKQLAYKKCFPQNNSWVKILHSFR